MSDQKLIPAIVQDYITGEVLMLAYMDDESLKRTKETGYTWFWSRSRQQYWKKGETSGNLQAVKEIRYDCDEDTYLVLVEQIGGKACHTGNRSCFYRQIIPTEGEIDTAPSFAGAGFLAELDRVIAGRKEQMPAGSYTAQLFEGGMEAISAKITEEAAEVVEAGFNETDDRVVSEAADLLYHLMVLLAERGLSLKDVDKKLESRHR